MNVFGFFHTVNDVIAQSATQWWVVPLIFVFCLVDGFFLFFPSETAIVALAAIATTNGGVPNFWYLVAAGALGAMVGDNLSYALGRRIGTAGFRWMRRPRVERAMHWARWELDRRGIVLIFTARYIPVGRVAVNFTAGATQFPWKSFMFVDIFGCLLWAAYGGGIGTFAASWIQSNHLLGVVIAIVFAIAMGFFVDHLVRIFHRWMDKRNGHAPEHGAVAKSQMAKGDSTGKGQEAEGEQAGAPLPAVTGAEAVPRQDAKS